VRKIEFGLKGARNYFWYRARVNLLTARVWGKISQLPKTRGSGGKPLSVRA